MGCEEEVEENRHMTACKSYSKFREGKDLSKYEDLVNYFRQVMEARRKKIM